MKNFKNSLSRNEMRTIYAGRITPMGFAGEGCGSSCPACTYPQSCANCLISEGSWGKHCI